MSPILLQRMIAKQKIVSLVEEKLENDMFLVDASVSPSNVIHVEIDSFDGLTIDQCVAVSRFIESHLDREEEDFELQVSSPGIDQYFKVKPQYQKNIGRELNVTTQQDAECIGKLIEAGENGISLEVRVKEKPEGGKKKQTVIKTLSLDYENIKKAKVIISFK